MTSALDQWRGVLEAMHRELDADRQALENGEIITNRSTPRRTDMPPIPAELIGQAQALMRDHEELISMVGSKMSVLQPPAVQTGSRSSARSAGRFETVA